MKSQAQAGLPAVFEELQNAIGGRRWQANASTPYFFYKDTKTGLVHRVDYDDIESLSIKYFYAKVAGARGVGMWTASSIDYKNASHVHNFWQALKAFTA